MNMKNFQNAESRRILIDGRLLSNSHTGISRYTEEMIKGAQRIWGYENVTVIVNKKLNKQFFNSIETDLRPFNIKDFFLFHFFLRKQEFGLLFSPFYANSYFKIKGKKYVSVVHDLMYSLVPGFFSNNRIINRIGKLYYDFIIKRTLRNSDITISVSETTRRDVEHLFNHPSVVFSEGVNILDEYKDEIDSNEILEKNNLTSNNYFLYVGIDRPHKNLDFLCRTFSKINSTKKLVLCGKHKHQYNYSNIVDLGYVNDEDLIILYKNSIAFIFASKYEGFGLPILEALSLKTKVISANTGALSEFDSRFVKFFNPSDEKSLLKAFEEIDEFEIDMAELYAYLEKFNWSRISDTIMEYCKVN